MGLTHGETSWRNDAVNPSSIASAPRVAERETLSRCATKLLAFFVQRAWSSLCFFAFAAAWGSAGSVGSISFDSLASSASMGRADGRKVELHRHVVLCRFRRRAQPGAKLGDPAIGSADGPPWVLRNLAGDFLFDLLGDLGGVVAVVRSVVRDDLSSALDERVARLLLVQIELFLEKSKEFFAIVNNGEHDRPFGVLGARHDEPRVHGARHVEHRKRREHVFQQA